MQVIVCPFTSFIRVFLVYQEPLLEVFVLDIHWSQLTKLSSKLRELYNSCGQPIILVMTYPNLVLNIRLLLQNENVPYKIAQMKDRGLITKLRNLELAKAKPNDTALFLQLEKDRNFIQLQDTEIVNQLLNQLAVYTFEPNYKLRNVARYVYQKLDMLSQLMSTFKTVASITYPLFIAIPGLNDSLSYLVRHYWKQNIKPLTFDPAQILIAEAYASLAAFTLEDVITCKDCILTDFYPVYRNFAFFKQVNKVVPQEKFVTITQFLDYVSNEIQIPTNVSNEIYRDFIRHWQQVVHLLKIEGLVQNPEVKESYTLTKALSREVLQAVSTLQTFDKVLDELPDETFYKFFEEVNHLVDKYTALLLYVVLDETYKRFGLNLNRIMKYIGFGSHSEGLTKALKSKLLSLQENFEEAFGKKDSIKKFLQFALLTLKDLKAGEGVS